MKVRRYRYRPLSRRGFHSTNERFNVKRFYRLCLLTLKCGTDAAIWRMQVSRCSHCYREMTETSLWHYSVVSVTRFVGKITSTSPRNIADVCRVFPNALLICPMRELRRRHDWYPECPESARVGPRVSERCNTVSRKLAPVVALIYLENTHTTRHFCLKWATSVRNIIFRCLGEAKVWKPESNNEKRERKGQSRGTCSRSYLRIFFSLRTWTPSFLACPHQSCLYPRLSFFTQMVINPHEPLVTTDKLNALYFDLLLFFKKKLWTAEKPTLWFLC